MEAGRATLSPEQPPLTECLMYGDDFVSKYNRRQTRIGAKSGIVYKRESGSLP